MRSMSGFTFHYVSIKTRHAEYLYTAYPTLHSTMSLLKRRTGGKTPIQIVTLHSTMSLLKPTTTIAPMTGSATLHSTMSLLKRGQLNAQR